MKVYLGNRGARTQPTRMSRFASRVVRTRYAVRANDPTSVRLPDEYVEELRNAELLRQRRESRVQEVVSRCNSIGELLEYIWRHQKHDIDVQQCKLDFIRAYLHRDDAVLNVLNEDGEPYLAEVAMRVELKILELLLQDDRVDVNATDAKNWGALQAACSVWGDVNVVKLLLESADLDVNAKSKNGWTALYEAAFQRHADIVHALLADGRADINVRLDNGSTVVDAVMQGALLSAKYIFDDEKMQKLYQKSRTLVDFFINNYGIDFDFDLMVKYLAIADEFDA